jgi:hypothetical protein
MDASNLICEKLVPIYSNFIDLEIKFFKGYKLVEKRNLNYYSIVSGLFRYKSGKIKHSSYSTLYEKNPEFYNKNLHNRLSVFQTPEDANNFLKEYSNICGVKKELVILEIEIAGNLQSAVCENQIIKNIDCVIGDSIISIIEF